MLLSRFKSWLWVVVMLVVGLSVVPAGGSGQGAGASPKRTDTIPGVSMRLCGLKMTSEEIELRCEIRNDSQQDIWLFREGGWWDDDRREPALLFRDTECDELGGAALFMDTDGETLVVLRRMNVPEHVVIHFLTGIPPVVYAVYYRLPAGQHVAETLYVNLPVKLLRETGRDRGLTEPVARDAMVASRLAFEIGYYTTEFLNTPFKRKAGSQTRINFGGLGDRVVVTDDLLGWLWRHEHVVRLTIEGAAIPYGDWLDFKRDESETRVSDLDLRGSLFKVKSQKKSEEPKAPPTPLERLEALFYDFSLGVQEYRYARRLLRIDEGLFDQKARAIADLYLQVAEGKLTPKDLPGRLDEVGVRDERERVLDELESKAAAADRKKTD